MPVRGLAPIDAAGRRTAQDIDALSGVQEAGAVDATDGRPDLIAEFDVVPPPGHHGVGDRPQTGSAIDLILATPRGTGARS